ncbi:hypothetical protein Moror_682 [Moniliophthora roreri MCA 2997]|uniref:Retrotransposon gag domain-containing protein n=1 Tax=Moniliophthora roreri (strain MCA 2997) TaxID=1381753 RepID=V2W515_MONRO|nr:hypothetical protein Moror_682 [Moniliophthora roreri MCA 2997]
MILSVATAVLEEQEKKKKNKGAKVAAPDPFEGDRKDTKWFLTKVEIYICMHPSDYNTDEKKCEEELKWTDLKNAFKKHYLPADIQADAQLRIEDAKMGERADSYVNNFRVMANESGYDDQALIHIFCKGLPFVLADKILNQPQGRPTDLAEWYEAAIRFDEQYKYTKAVQKPRRFQMAADKKKKFEKKETTVN